MVVADARPLTERVENHWACDQVDQRNQAISDVVDEASATKQEITMDRLVTDYIDCFHNHKRRHSSLGMLTPTEYENLYAPMLQLP